MELCIIVKLPKYYRSNKEMAKFIGPFKSWEDAQNWVKETFTDYQDHMFTYVNVFKP